MNRDQEIKKLKSKRDRILADVEKIDEEVDRKMPRITFRVSQVQLSEIDSAWVKKGKFNRSDGLRWLLELGLQKAKTEGIV